MDEQQSYERHLRFLTGSEFTKWKETELDARAEAHLGFAIQAASTMSPDGCFKAAHHLLLYASLTDMGTGAQQKAELNLYEMQNAPKEG